MIVPQYLGRLDFVLVLEQVAILSGAAFVEILLLGSQPVTEERFRRRRQELRTHGQAHPQGDVADAVVEATIADALERHRQIRQQRARVGTITVSDDIKETYAALVAAIAECHR